ncbi:MAG: hypothetical protein AAFO07_28170 [Bacteroidota bacterium]
MKKKIQSIRHLIDIITPQKIRSINILDEKDDNVNKLYTIIKEERNITEEEIIEILYPNNKYGKQYLNRLNSKLQERLMNTLMTIHVDDLDNTYNDRINLFKKHAMLQILNLYQNSQFAELAKEILKESMRLHMTEVSISVLRMLTLWESNITNDKKAYLKYKNLQNSYKIILLAELEIELLVKDLIVTSYDKWNSNIRLEKQSITANKIIEIMNNHYSYRIYSMGGMTLLAYYSVNHRYKEIAALIQKLKEKLYDLNFDIPSTVKFSFNYNIVPYYIMSKNFDKAEDALEQCEKYSKRSLYNRNIILFLRKLKASYQKNYNEIIDLTKDKTNLKLAKYHAETFILFDAYAKILTGQKLRLTKTLNSTPEYSKQKRSMNVNLLIIQVLEYARRKQYDKIIDRIDALKQYSHRYLRDDATYRSNCFIRLLLCLPRGHFNQVGVKRVAEPYLEKLLAKPILETNQDYEVEMVPFEDLWEFVVSLLPEKP